MADEFARELSDVSIELERVSDLAESVGKSLTNAFRGAIVDGRSLRDVLSDVSRAFADIALKAALQPVGTLISSGVETLFNGLNPALGGVAAAPVARAAAQAAGAVTHVTFNVTSPDARSFAASEAEVSAMLLRAVKRGTRAS
jgi:uncharacterized protein (DUF697 family)